VPLGAGGVVLDDDGALPREVPPAAALAQVGELGPAALRRDLVELDRPGIVVADQHVPAGGAVEHAGGAGVQQVGEGPGHAATLPQPADRGGRLPIGTATPRRSIWSARRRCCAPVLLAPGSSVWLDRRHRSRSETTRHIMIKLASGQVNVLITSGSRGFPNGFIVQNGSRQEGCYRISPGGAPTTAGQLDVGSGIAGRRPTDCHVTVADCHLPVADCDPPWGVDILTLL